MRTFSALWAEVRFSMLRLAFGYRRRRLTSANSRAPRRLEPCPRPWHRLWFRRIFNGGPDSAPVSVRGTETLGSSANGGCQAGPRFGGGEHTEARPAVNRSAAAAAFSSADPEKTGGHRPPAASSRVLLARGRLDGIRGEAGRGRLLRSALAIPRPAPAARPRA